LAPILRARLSVHMSQDPTSQPASEYELQALLDATVDAVIVIDAHGIIESFNRSGERLFGYTSEEVIGHNVSMLMTHRDRDSHDRYMARYLATGVPHIIGIGREVDAEHKDGSVFPVFLSVGQIHGSRPPRFIGLLHDITLRREAMMAIRRERDRANMYLEMAQVILLALSTDYRVQLINRKGCETLSRREMDLLGRDWLHIAVPDDQRALLEEEFRAMERDPSGAERYFEHAVQSAHGERRLIAWRCIPMRNAEGRLTGFFSSGEDITDSRRAFEDAQASQERLTQVSRLATLGEMAAGIAHELNQPLAAISNYAHAAQRFAQSLALDRIDTDGDIRAALEQIASQAVRAGEIIRRLRGLVQNRNTQKEPSDLNHLLQEVLGFVQSEIRLRQIRISLELDPTLPSVPLDRIQIQQVLLNLLRNAIEALENAPPTARQILLRTQSSPSSGYIRFVISDSGPGVPEDILPQIFDPFCTSKSTGTGLGLAISRTIAEAHHGKLNYEHAPGGGAQFVLSLPHSNPGGSL
jgi:two-component system sensor kinase FixL